MKKISLFLLSLLGILFLSSCSSENVEECFMVAVEEENGEKFVTVSGYNFDSPKCSMDVVIPEEIDGIPVKKIWQWAFENPHLEHTLKEKNLKIIIKEIKRLDCSGDVSKECKKMFEDIKEKSKLRFIQSVVMPEGIEEIWADAFSTNNLQEIRFGKNIKQIQMRAFMFNNLSTISFHPDASDIVIWKHVFLYNNLQNIEIPYGTKYGTEEESSFNPWVEVSFK